nr:hypothetical protein CFP56_61342 [Quercus suber]
MEVKQCFKDDDESNIDEEDEVLHNRPPPLLNNAASAAVVPIPNNNNNKVTNSSNVVITSIAILDGACDGGIAHLGLHAVPSGEGLIGRYRIEQSIRHGFQFGCVDFSGFLFCSSSLI